MSYPLRSVAAVTALGLAGATVWALTGSDDAGTGAASVNLGRIEAVSLSTKRDCSDLLDYYRDEGSKAVGPFGLSGFQLFGGGMTRPGVSARMEAGIATADSATPNSGTNVQDSSTNVQVAGVDEGDAVKTNGDLMVSVVNGEVQVSRLRGADTKVLSTWSPATSTPQSVLLDGDTAVIIGDRAEGTMDIARIGVPGGPAFSSSAAVLTVLDLADPEQPRPIRQLQIDGQRSGDVRLVDGELRLAVTANVRGIEWKNPVYPDPRKNETPAEAQVKLEQAENAAIAANRTLVATSQIENWIPQATVTELNAASKPTGKPVTRALLGCDQVSVPGTFSGLDTLAMVSIDLGEAAPLTTWRSAGVVASGSILYATADHAWIATSRWSAMPLASKPDASTALAPVKGSGTQIHRFDTVKGQAPAYVASGEIEGVLLSQFAMDEKDGFLRVASTTESALPATDNQVQPTSEAQPTTDTSDGAASDGAAGDGAGANGSVGDSMTTMIAPGPANTEARVSVLKVEGNQLKQVGVVTGLGVGEEIRGVRFVGDVGYVVTYRQTDPLYTVDLTDPTSPTVRGELKVLGYSAYLHPLGAGKLLGLGQDGTAEGVTTGLQLSLFDVSDLTDPRRIDEEQLPGAWSDAEGDHHAFTLAGDLALVPYTAWTSVNGPSADSGRDLAPQQSQFDTGVIAVRVDADGIGTPTTLRPIADGPVTIDASGQIKKSVQTLLEATPIRTVVHDGTIYTLTPGGIAAHDVENLTRLTFATF